MSTIDPRHATVRQYVPEDAPNVETSRGDGWVAFAARDARRWSRC